MLSRHTSHIKVILYLALFRDKQTDAGVMKLCPTVVRVIPAFRIVTKPEIG